MVERVYRRLKDEFGARSIRVRGATKIMAHLMFGVLALTLDQLLKLTGQAVTSAQQPIRPECCFFLSLVPACPLCSRLLSPRRPADTRGESRTSSQPVTKS